MTVPCDNARVTASRCFSRANLATAVRLKTGALLGSTMAALLDPVVDVLEEGSHPLDSLFKPKRVAVIGATDREGSVGRTLLRNLISNPFGGVVYPVNPKREHVLGISSFKSIAACPGQIDLAVVITPASTVPAVVKECVDNKALVLVGWRRSQA